MARALIVLGILLVVVGLLWPWLMRIGLGRFPGDFVFGKGSFRVYFPLTTSVIISLVLTLIFWLFRR
ncbi:MAG TPA: DUF2905 domain-containing protein [Chromatiales bacterium]|nr:DUF2905 domain-containing protein [Chromatiales bacterium]